MFVKTNANLASFALAGLLSFMSVTSLSAQTVAGESDGATVDRLVSTKGLNLAAPADQAILRHRVAVAANQVCMQVMPGEAINGDAFLGCYGAARTQAWAQAELRIAAAQGAAVLASAAP